MELHYGCAFAPKNDLRTFSKSFLGTILDIRLDIEDDASKQRIAVQNLVLQLRNSAEPAVTVAHGKTKQLHMPMPGFHGPHPSSSDGVGVVEVLQSGHFIDLTFKVKLHFAATPSSWELVWRQNSPAGKLICGLDLLEDAVRNAAKLPKGRIYVPITS